MNFPSRSLILGLLAALLLVLPGDAHASKPSTTQSLRSAAAQLDAAAATAAQATPCSAFKRKARRARSRRTKLAYQRKYRKCLARSRSRGRRQPTAAPPQVPAVTPAPTPQARNLYLPSVLPNPNGYRATQTCYPNYVEYYNRAGFVCIRTHFALSHQYTGVPGQPPIWVQTPVFQLFGVWSCANGQVALTC